MKGEFPRNVISTHTKVVFPFVLTQKVLNKLRLYATDRLRRLEENLDPTFQCFVEYRNSSVESFKDFQALEEYAGNKNSAIRKLSLTWKVFLAGLFPETACINIIFLTEERNLVNGLNWFEIPLSKMALKVEGSRGDWVEETRCTLAPILHSVKIVGLYKPLAIFRHRALVNISSGMFALALAYHLGLEITFTEMFQIDAGFAKVIIIYLFSRFLLPVLTPKSGILIGLESERYKSYQNDFRFVVFTLLFGGLGVIILKEILESIFF